MSKNRLKPFDQSAAGRGQDNTICSTIVLRSTALDIAASHKSLHHICQCRTIDPGGLDKVLLACSRRLINRDKEDGLPRCNGEPNQFSIQNTVQLLLRAIDEMDEWVIRLGRQ